MAGQREQRGEAYKATAPPPPSSPSIAGRHGSLSLLPREPRFEELARDGLSPGLMSAGLGSVPAEQTYLDITQGNRVFDSLYSYSPLPRHGCGARLERRSARAESAPAEIVPGLLGSERWKSLASGSRASGACGLSAGGVEPGLSRLSGRSELSARDSLARPTRAARLSRRSLLAGNDLLIAIARPPPAKNGALAIGIAGRGFDGNLTSDSTRLDGYVLSTDVAPTILERLGVAVPSQMSGQPIRSRGLGRRRGGRRAAATAWR